MTKQNIRKDSKTFLLFSELLKEHFQLRFGIKKLNWYNACSLSVSILIKISKSHSSILAFKAFHLLQKAQQHSVI